MILADTSVWIGHFRSDDPRLRDLLEEDRVLCHPFIIGELALGNLRRRQDVLRHLQALPAAPAVEPEEALEFVEKRKLFGRGIGYVDAHLLASASVAGAALWTLDARLHGVAEDLGLAPKIRKELS